MVARVFIPNGDRGEESKEAETQRERECVCEWEHWRKAVVASVVNRLLENTRVKINKIIGICGLSLISKMRNLANGFSHGGSV